MLAKIRHIGKAGWPFIVAELDGELVGYAYATQFRDRAAYRFACEDSIYVAPDRMRQGIGKALLAALVDRAAAFGFRTMTAVIGGAEPGSIAVHAALGFTEAGRLKAMGSSSSAGSKRVYAARAWRRLELSRAFVLSSSRSPRSLPASPKAKKVASFELAAISRER